MTISTGDSLPDATFIRMGPEGPEQVNLSDKTAGRKVVIFGLPGAFSGTCSTAHLPSFMRTKPQFDEAGVDEIICVSVNDPFVMLAWEKDTGADVAGITLLSDAAGDFTKAIGMDFDAPQVGLMGRSKRYAMLVDDNRVSVFQTEEKAGVCDLSTGEKLLEAM